MKIFLISLAILCWLMGCSAPQTSDQWYSVPDTLFTTASATTNLIEPKSEDCDSLKFPDFKNNMTAIDTTILSNAFQNKISHLAHEFIKDACQQDHLFCDTIYLKNVTHYHTQTDLTLFSFAYAFKGSETSMEKESAAFFVFGICQNEAIIFHDIAADLLGEIQLALLGFEIKNNKKIIWGEMYPYFSSEEYGKFKLSVSPHESTYEFQCRAQER
jgi:hypothetical protein